MSKRFRLMVCTDNTSNMEVAEFSRYFDNKREAVNKITKETLIEMACDKIGLDWWLEEVEEEE